MKKIIALIGAIAAVCTYVALGSAESMSIDNIKFSGKTIDYVNDTITIDGRASFLNMTKQPIQPGQMRLDSLTSSTIRIDLVKGADKRMTANNAVASGGVKIEARRSVVSKDQPPVIQNVHATAQSAVMDSNQDSILMTGDVVVKVTEPGALEPINTIVGDRVVFSLKENKVRVEGQSEKPAEITMMQKEKPKSETGQK